MTELRFDLRDLFRSARLGFSMQRMWIAFLGYGVGYAGYLIFTYLSLLVDGKNVSVIWNQYGLFTCLSGHGAVHWYSWLVFLPGVVFLLIAFLLTSTAISRATYMLLKGNNFYTWREAFAFSFRKAGSIISTPVAILVLALLLLVGGLIIGFLGRIIPVVGELGVSLFTVVWLVASLLMVFLLLALGVSLILVPAIIATTDEDAFEAVFQSFSTLWSQPWRFIVYEAVVCVIGIFSLGIFAFIVKEAYLLMSGIFSVPWAFGDEFINIAAQAQFLLQKWLFLSQEFVNSIYWRFAEYIYFKNEFYHILSLTAVQKIAAYFMAVSMLVIVGWVASYGMAVIEVGNTIVYLILRKKKDDDNLLERVDKEEEEPEETDLESGASDDAQKSSEDSKEQNTEETKNDK